MFAFVIDKHIFGTDSHFLCSPTGFQWVEHIPSDVWWLNGNIKINSDMCLDTLLKLNGVDIELNPPSQFVNAIQLVTSGSLSEIPWAQVMPAHAHRSFMRDVVEQVAESIKVLDKAYYESVWIPGNRVFRSLKRAKINKANWQELVDKRVGNVAVVETFKPAAGGYATDTVYNRFGTRTGRLTITSGPSILTLKREYRAQLIESRWGDSGNIMMIDFANLEPRILLHEAGKRCDHVDLYTFLNDELFAGQGDRNIIKGAVISELYGISKRVLQQKLGVSLTVVNEFTKRIKTYFETKKLLQRIKQQFVSKGYITNRYGRRVEIEEPLNHIFVNSYAQSTGSDVAILGFDQLISGFEGKKIVPLYMVADALIVDVHNDERAYVNSLKKVKVDGYVQPYHLKVEELSCTSV